MRTPMSMSVMAWLMYRKTSSTRGTATPNRSPTMRCGLCSAHKANRPRACFRTYIQIHTSHPTCKLRLCSKITEATSTQQLCCPKRGCNSLSVTCWTRSLLSDSCKYSGTSLRHFSRVSYQCTHQGIAHKLTRIQCDRGSTEDPQLR